MQTPEFYNFAVDVVDRWAGGPDRLALWWVNETGSREEKRSFAAIARSSRSIAAAAQQAGLEPGSRVLVLVGRRPAWWEVMIGLVRAGVVSAPGTTLLSVKDIAYRLQAARIDGVVAAPELADRVDEAISRTAARLRWKLVVDDRRDGWQSLEEVLAQAGEPRANATAAGDPCLLYFTSGTTGPPKMVLHTHVSYPLGHLVTGRDWLGLREGDLHWNLSDTGWAKAAWSSLFGPWQQGATVFVQEPGPKFDPLAMLRTLERYPITTLCAPPTAFRQLVTLDLKGRGLEKLREVVAAGEPLNPEVIAVWREATGRTIRDGFGQTETTILLGNFPGRPVRPGSMGMPAPGFEVVLVDEQLQALPAGVEGEIAVRVRPVRPLGLFVEYLDNSEENARKFRGDYYLTGDRAIRDDDGYYWFIGRGDDVILSGGYRIGPFEVESALVEHPAVAEAAVVASPDAERFQIVKAYVVLAPGAKPSEALAAELKEHVKRTTAPYKYPREIEFVDALPKTISGKILRGELRRRESERKK